MRNFLFNYLNLFRALGVSLLDGRSLHLIAMSASLVVVSTTFYVFMEGWSILDAAYFSVVTMSTVGYGDLSPNTSGSASPCWAGQRPERQGHHRPASILGSGQEKEKEKGTFGSVPRIQNAPPTWDRVILVQEEPSC